MIIIQDTREKTPWDFTFYENCTEQIVGTVKTGDYTIQGFEDKICIERKRNTSELAINLGKKSKPFYKELERMKSFRYRYIICEFPFHIIGDFPKNSGMPRNKYKFVKMNPNFIKSQINAITDKYEIEFIFCNTDFDAQEKAIEIMWEKYNVLKKEV